MVRLWFTLLLGVLAVCLYGQQGYTIQINAVDTTTEFFNKRLQPKQGLKDTAAVKKELRQLLQKIRSAGFASASVDTIIYEEATCKALFYIGSKLSTIYIRKGNIEPSFLRDAGFKNFGVGKQMTATDIEQLQAKLLTKAENSGYPFAEVYLDSFATDPLSASVMLERHELFVYDSIHFMEKTRVKHKFLMAYLGIKKGKPYNESKIRAVNQRLNALQFAEQTQAHSVVFDKEKAKLQVYLRNRKASAFNFFLGILPGGAGQKVLVTGEAKLHLFSPFGFGEQLSIEWNKTLPKTQVLKAMFAFPYLFGLPMGVDLRFELFKRDTSWLDIDRDFGLSYQFEGMSYVKASLKQKTTIVLKTDTAFIKLNRRLPNAIDINTNEFAFEYYYMNLDYRFNPTSGWQINIGGSAGEKRVKRNNLISDLRDETTGETFNYLYDSIGLRNYQLQFSLSVEKFWKLTRRMTFLTSLKGKYFYSPLIFENEKYRIGGMGSLRGFTEQSIITPYYAIANIEYRYLLSKNAFFYTFFNAAVTQLPTDTDLFDWPFGFGAGVSLETKVGIFGITYALGQKADTKLSFRDSKIHFGYVNYF